MTRKDWKLDPEAVRRRAASVQGCKEVLLTPDLNPALCSFLVGIDDSGCQVQNLARVNVYADTGTIGTCRIQQGEVREVFRRNISDLNSVEGILRNPPTITIIDENIVGMTDTESPTTKVSLQTGIELADVGLAILQGEKEKLRMHLEALDDRSILDDSSRSVTSVTSRSESSLGLAGIEFQFSLPPHNMKHVDQCLGEIIAMNKIVRGVATNGKGTVFLYGNAGVAYTPNIPRPLYSKLSQLRSSAITHRPRYVSLGTRDRYFVSFHDATFAFKGPKGLERDLKNSPKTPRSVAFGSTFDTYFIVFDDGSWKCQGRGLPKELEEKLATRGDRDDLTIVNLGPAGEWFLRANDGKTWWGNVSEELNTAINDLTNEGHYLSFVDFGVDGSYLISYD
jgi:hypothetical protein